MARTTPPRPYDPEALFPALAAHRGTTTRLHPRPGTPAVTDSHVGGPLLWPADAPWPVCTHPHPRDRGRRPQDIRLERFLAEFWVSGGGRPAGEEKQELLRALRDEYEVPGLADTDPIPLLGVAQFHRRDVPDLPVGPDGCDLLQLFWCPFDRHGETGRAMHVELRWQRSDAVTDPLTEQPEPEVVGYEGYVPAPCVLHPEQVTTYQYGGLLPAELEAAITAWELLPGPRRGARPCYQYDLSIPPGWRVGGFASWHLTDPYPMDCAACGRAMALVLTVDSSEWDGGTYSWIPLEDGPSARERKEGTPTNVTVGRWGELNVFGCPADPAHPPRWSVQ
ncbi:hypothetical protein [Streptomyces yangpuensis]|uniref:hypothetical protein n=1 Tax=Streptomyces yangpuensis TaxID=1648182 RepID=UPI00371925F2